MRKAFKMTLEDGPGQSHVRKELPGIIPHIGIMLVRTWRHKKQWAVWIMWLVMWSLWGSRRDEEIMRKMDWTLSSLAAPSQTFASLSSSLPPNPLSNGTQGSVLGSLPFSIYIHILYDLVHSFGLESHPYSDDSLVYVSNAYPEPSLDLQLPTDHTLRSLIGITKSAWCSLPSPLLLQPSPYWLFPSRCSGQKSWSQPWFFFFSHTHKQLLENSADSAFKVQPNLTTSHHLCCYRSELSHIICHLGFFNAFLTGLPASTVLSYTWILNTEATAILLKRKSDHVFPLLKILRDLPHRKAQVLPLAVRAFIHSVSAQEGSLLLAKFPPHWPWYLSFTLPCRLFLWIAS